MLPSNLTEDVLKQRYHHYHFHFRKLKP